MRNPSTVRGLRGRAGCLAALLSLVPGAALAQGSIGPSTLPPECTVSISIGTVKHLGRQDRKDRIQIDWTVNGPQSPCGKVTSFVVKAKVTRKRGHVDEGRSSNVAGSARSVVVEVARELAETDPATIDASVEALVGFDQEQTLVVEGNGPPVVAAGSSTKATLPDTCKPSIKLEKINFFPNLNGKDSIGIFWTPAFPSKCTVPHATHVTVQLTRADGKVDSKTTLASVDPKVTSANVEFAAGAPIEKHRVTIFLEARGQARVFSASKRVSS